MLFFPLRNNRDVTCRFDESGPSSHPYSVRDGIESCKTCIGARSIREDPSSSLRRDSRATTDVRVRETPDGDGEAFEEVLIVTGLRYYGEAQGWRFWLLVGLVNE
jgi:hypothetical protein